MTRRYFVPQLPESGGLVSLGPDEAAHARRVMRVEVGHSVTLFDGKGREAEARVASLGRNECHCEASPANAVDREPVQNLHLGIALPKPDRARELIERLTELGVAAVTPLTADRTQRPPSTSQMEKMRRSVVEACKQCGRNQLVEIHEPISATDFFNTESSSIRLIAHPSMSSISLGDIRIGDDIPSPGTWCVAIGPEGGWTEREITVAREAGFRAIDLGPRIYRIETAAVVTAAVLLIR